MLFCLLFHVLWHVFDFKLEPPMFKNARLKQNQIERAETISKACAHESAETHQLVDFIYECIYEDPLPGSGNRSVFSMHTLHV